MRQKPINKKASSSTPLLLMLAIISLCIIFGVIFSFIMAPNEFVSNGGPGTNSVIRKDESQYLRKIKTDALMVPEKNLNEELDAIVNEDLEGEVDWSKEFWSPIDLEIGTGKDPYVSLCKINFKEYYENPHLYAMFKFVTDMSKCTGSNSKRAKLSTLLKEIKEAEGLSEGRVIKPSGFVFHESRVGSTLVANTLASDPMTMVYSESPPPANALLHCTACTHEENVQLFRDIVTVMGRSPFHKRLFFKFQSITTTKMEIALEAFPDTPWAFVYRTPVQTMMSHLDPKKGSSGAPCLRSMRNPPNEVTDAIASVIGKEHPPNEAWCAAHLNMLCNSAIRAYEKFSLFVDSNGNKRQRGLLINYESLPGSVGSLMLPVFGVKPSTTWLAKMASESQHYSKGKGESIIFEGDSKDKDERATEAIQKFSNLILQPTYNHLVQLSEESFSKGAPMLWDLVPVNEADQSRDWKFLSKVPQSLSSASLHAYKDAKVGVSNSMYAARGLKTNEVLSQNFDSSSTHDHHSKFDPVTYIPWEPFSNTHNSKPFERAKCPPVPDPDYPNTYSMVDITNNWNTDNTEIPPMHYDALCHFDYQNETEHKMAETYRTAEVPFVVYNIPEVDKVSRNWNNIDYLRKKLGNKKYRTETSKDNHFMYWNGDGKGVRERSGKMWEPPTGMESETFDEWLNIAVVGQNKSLETRKHRYFRVSSDADNNWLFDELPFFQPKKQLMIVNPHEQRGIHCRFGMRSVIAEAHFDGSRNAVVMLGGMRRWVLAHPNQCKHMHMLPINHPSGRHSEVDWSRPDLVTFPNFAKIRGNEVIVQPGDFLYIPTYWIHYIVSLNVNFQCNTRSGRTKGFDQDIRDCGF